MFVCSHILGFLHSACILHLSLVLLYEMESNFTVLPGITIAPPVNMYRVTGTKPSSNMYLPGKLDFSSSLSDKLYIHSFSSGSRVLINMPTGDLFTYPGLGSGLDSEREYDLSGYYLYRGRSL